jgi:hypothetical protein
LFRNRTRVINEEFEVEITHELEVQVKEELENKKIKIKERRARY